jgi:hypothetical protein
MKRFIAMLRTNPDGSSAVEDGILLGIVGVVAMSCLPGAWSVVLTVLRSAGQSFGWW